MLEFFRDHKVLKRMVLTRKKVKESKSERAWLAPLVVFAILGALTILVWKQQVDHQQSLLANHTEDVSVQASRRLQVFVESHLRMASIFARRWSTHESRDFSRQRFDEFASVLIQELPGYYAVGLIPPDLGSIWTVPHVSEIAETALNESRVAILKEVRQNRQIVLSAPFKSESGETAFYAVLPLVRSEVLLGYLVVDFHTETLINDCFHTRIRSEFHFRIHDEEEVLFQSSQEIAAADFDKASSRTSIEFPVRNRKWQLTVLPRKERVAASGWFASISVPLLGLFLSVGLSLLVFLLARRMNMYRSARDKTLHEMEERRKTETALKESESRYRNVFDSATDGLLVLGLDGCIIEANNAAGEIHGYHRNELVGMPVQELIVPEQRRRYQEFRDQLDQRGMARVDSVDMRKDGSHIDVEIRGARLTKNDEQRLLAVISDVSEQKRAIERHTLLSRKAITAQEEERARLSMELHDELGQILTALRLEMDFARKQIIAAPEEKSDVLGNSTELTEKATDELRRICKGLRPPLLDDLGLEPAVRLLVDEFQERSGISTDFVLPVEESRINISQEVGLCAYRIIQESLTNIRRHSQATKVDISLVYTNDSLELSVCDSGIGFDIDKLGALQGWGLEGMQERANLVNGEVHIRSTPNQGTRVVLRVPISKSVETEVP